MSAIAAWFATSRLGRIMAAVGAIALAALAVRWKWMADGRRQAQDEASRRTLDQVRQRNDVEDAVRRMGDGAVSDELHNDWSRP